MGQFSEAAYKCLIDRVNRTIATGDEEKIRALQSELLNKCSLADSFEWDHMTKRVEFLLYMIDNSLGESNDQETQESGDQSSDD